MAHIPTLRYGPLATSSSVLADKPQIVVAKLNNQQAGVNTVTPAPATLNAHQDVEPGWRREEDGILLTNPHQVTPKAIDSVGHGVSFTENLNQTNRITDVALFDQFAAQREAGVPPRQIWSSPTEWPWDRGTTQGLPSGATMAPAPSTPVPYPPNLGTPPHGLSYGDQHPESAGYAQNLPSAMSSGYHHLSQQPQSSQVYLWMPGSQQTKRPRRRWGDIERIYMCNHPLPGGEFKEMRKQWRVRKKEEDAERQAAELQRAQWAAAA